MSLELEEHRGYLSDTVRLEAFRTAVLQAVRPGDVVLDLASGTGILGLLACRAGASRVYAVESTGVIEVAQAVAAQNGFSDRVTFVQGFSQHITLPEKVDVIVCDQIGHFGFEAGLVENGVDARERWLRPAGRFVPGRVDLYVAPVEGASLDWPVSFWRSRPADFEFSAVCDWAANDQYPSTIAGEALLGPSRRAWSIDMMTATAGALAADVELEIGRGGVLHGLAGWFDAELVPGVHVTNAPTASVRLQRSQAFLPLGEAVRVEPGDVVDVRLHVIPSEMLLTWTVTVTRAGSRVAQARHSTLQGMLLTRAHVRRTDPRFVPTLTPRGRARLSVLELCDGARSLAEIEREVLARHPDLFPSLSEAAVFVGAVVSRMAGERALS